MSNSSRPPADHHAMDVIPGADEMTVGRFYDLLGEKLGLVPVEGDAGLSRQILSPDVSRPGMALTGYMHRFLHERIQIFGETEITYLESLTPDQRRIAVERIFQAPVYCSIVTKGLPAPSELVRASAEHDAAVMLSTRDTTPLIHDLTDYLTEVFAPRTNVYGSLVEVFGIGLLVTGKSAIGKSETVLGLLERGHRLIADDRVFVSRISGCLFGRGDSRMGHLMEIRGLGLVEVASFYGIRSVKDRQQIQFEVRLEQWSADNQDFDRTGLVQRVNTILDIPIPQTIIPVLPGRNLTLLLEIAVMNHLLLKRGRDVPREIEEDLIQRIIGKETGQER